jgi:hypothetical protein
LDYHRTVRKKIGDALSAGYDRSQPIPDTIGTLLGQLDEPSAQGLAAKRNSATMSRYLKVDLRYSAGGSCEAEDLYKTFRGRLPTADALMSKRGLVEAVG